jgi:hypothetical protein
MNKVKLVTVQRIYARMGTLYKEMDTMQQTHPKYMDNIKELNELRIKLESVMNSICPILK